MTKDQSGLKRPHHFTSIGNIIPDSLTLSWYQGEGLSKKKTVILHYFYQIYQQCTDVGSDILSTCFKEIVTKLAKQF